MENLNHQQQTTTQFSKNPIPEPQTVTSQSTYLPIGIITEILSRLPVLTILRFRVVCKTWYHLTQTEAFIHQQLQNFRKNKTKTDRCSISFPGNNTLVCSSQGHSRNVRIDMKRPYYRSNDCNGLVCLYTIYPDHFFICNPVVDDKFIKLPNVGMTEHEGQDARLCHDSHYNKYKVVRLFYCGITGVEVLTLGDSSWRQVGEFPAITRGHPVYVSGTMNWNTFEGKILFLEIENETCVLIETPVWGANGEVINMRFHDKLTNNEVCLGIVKMQNPWEFKFFIMKGYVSRIWIDDETALMQLHEMSCSQHEFSGHSPHA